MTSPAGGPRRVVAAVFLGPAAGFRLEELDLDPPGPGEILVRMAASGVCHSDLHVVDGDWERPVPVALGHEGAGIVEDVGPGVGVRPGDPRPGDLVVLAWTAPCRVCPPCRRGEGFLCSDPRGAGHRRAPAATRLRRPDGTPVGVYSGIGTFSTHQVVAAEAAIPVDSRLPADQAALIGCAVTTGVGAVTRTAAVEPGASVVVLGLGGIGLSAVMGAVLAGASPIVAVDRVDTKVGLAMELGATHGVVVAAADATRAAVLHRIPGGADHVVEAIGLAATAELALEVVRPGGTVTLVGMTAQGVRAGVEVYAFVERGIRLLGSNYGSADPAVAFPELAAHAIAGRLPIDRLIEERVGLGDLPRAFEAMRRGDGARRVVVIS
jgi:S-(hydroxymethyl)glutathione dehydrogenase/alcohol dehydrogenase